MIVRCTLEGPKLDTLLTVEQAAERRVAYVKLGRHVRIAEPDLINFVATGRVEPQRRHAEAG